MGLFYMDNGSLESSVYFDLVFMGAKANEKVEENDVQKAYRQNDVPCENTGMQHLLVVCGTVLDVPITMVCADDRQRRTCIPDERVDRRPWKVIRGLPPCGT